MDLGLHGKQALITGGSQGIGLAVAHALAAEGCHVALCGRSSERLAAAARALAGHAGVEVVPLPCDVLSAAAIDGCVAQLLARWDGVDILVNNVGGNSAGPAAPDEAGDRLWVEVYERNALAAVRFTTALLPSMRRRQWGRVVTVTSRLGREGGGGTPWYNMAKAAQTSLMKSLAMNPELARAGITFNSVAPGAVLTPDGEWAGRRQRDPDGFARRVDEKCPLGRLGTPEEVADVVVFLCSVRAGLVNGAAIAVDGAESRSF